MMMEVSVTSVLKGGAFPIWGAGNIRYAEINIKYWNNATLSSVVHSLPLTSFKGGGDSLTEDTVQVRVQRRRVLGLWS